MLHTKFEFNANGIFTRCKITRDGYDKYGSGGGGGGGLCFGN